MIKLGIIGAGRLGSFHADKAAAHPEVELVGVMDPVESARKKLAEKHDLRECSTLDELIAQVDAVVVAAPTYLHFDLGIPCLRRGCHVLMEKPMCASWDDARKMVDAAKRSNAVFQVGHVEQFNPVWMALQEPLREIRGGAPAIIETVRTSGYTFRSTDIGTVFDMMIHDIDLVLSLVPSRVVVVDAVGHNVIGGPHEDVADARIRFENGTVACLRSSRVAAKAQREMKISTPTLTAEIDFGTRSTVIRRPDKSVRQGEFAPDRISSASVPSIAPTFMQERFPVEEQSSEAVDALTEEMKDFVDAITSGRPPRVSGEQALAAVAVAEMIVESIRKGAPLQFGHLSRPDRRAA